MSKAELLEQLKREQEVLALLKVELAKAESDHLSEFRRYCESDCGSDRQEALRDRFLQESQDRVWHAQRAYDAQERIVKELSEKMATLQK
ncbi:hypothetical protein K3H45_09090 [Aeromonas veronii]|uniref:hypothetical protein n=1 Tax=Aeromonas veronii TaxID=654 RepID=UPI001F32CC66|nr:hypothetical protein [Aeromonas veronii]MCF5760051.1 hypothetical protein [Aeromonas veronii]